MSWAGLEAFLAMGGYGLYVWGAYLPAASLVATEIVLLVLRHRAALKRLPEHAAP